MLIRFFIVLFLVLVIPGQAQAYIGPGAGFAFLGSAFVFLLTFLMAVVTIAFWPAQWLWRTVKGKRISKRARTRRVIIVGLDGLEPCLVDRFFEEGRLSNLAALGKEGSYNRLGTTLPSLSPVAWSTFQTGVNPGAHNIFDFLTRDKRFCLPQLCSTETEPARRFISFGKFCFPLDGAKIRLMRKSQPFWKILGKYGIFSTILRVPISYPPEKFVGNILSAMCTPDLKGTQGTFSLFTTAEQSSNGKTTSGEVRKVSRDGNTIESYLEGPPHPYCKSPTPLRVAFSLTLDPANEQAELIIGKEKETLKLNTFSRWITIDFKYGWGKTISGICRFCLREIDPNFTLYVSPINVNPEKPALPIAQPIFFSTFLAKRQGLFGTLGFMEDTWGRNEHAIDDARFLEQTYLTHEERERMFFDAMEKTREGVCACVFDASDRIQHMFWRYLEEDHPAPREEDQRMFGVIREMYEKMDDLVGRVRAEVRKDDVLIVLSDHGFTSFKRCLNLNTWLYKEGYLATKGDVIPETEYFQDVDWSRTKAFAVGLSGIYLNRRGRERYGIVDNDEAEVIKREIAEKLCRLEDPDKNQPAIRRVYDTAKEYRGLYRNDAPDLLVGFERGYRTSWESVVGGMKPELFEDNVKAWSGDHGVDPELVPGILFCNRQVENGDPHIADLAPTVLDLFAVPVPAYMEGKVLF